MIGQSTVRVGGVERVTGAQKYAADIRLDHPLHVKLVHLDCARAGIQSIDTHAAQCVEGVRCILTAADLPQPVPRFGPAYADRPVLAVSETKFFGEPVAAVAAETLDAAETAAAMVRLRARSSRRSDDRRRARSRRRWCRRPSCVPATPAVNTLDEWRFGWGDVRDAEPMVIENSTRFRW